MCSRSAMEFPVGGSAPERRHATLRSTLAKSGVAVVLAAGGLAGPALFSPSAAFALDSTTFAYTGAEQQYSVPAGITQVAVTAVGGKGSNPYGTGGTFGYGATVSATVTLPAGTTTLYVEVGGNGGTFENNAGWNGGGPGAYYTTLQSAGGGGGASDVRTVSRATPLSTTDSRLVVAGGGGGAGRNVSCPTQPDGGAAGVVGVTGAGMGGVGDYGETCAYSLPPYTPVGQNGGFGSPAGAVYGYFATAGTLGQGGSGAGYFWGGGGGGGYFGGGGGGGANFSGGGGGGGSSYWITGATGTSMSTDATGVPSVTITPILLAPDASTTVLATKTGRGAVALSWTDHGAAITGHTIDVYLYKKGNAKRPAAYTYVESFTSGPDSTWAMSGLTHGVLVFRVSATNASGTSPMSDWSNAVRV